MTLATMESAVGELAGPEPFNVKFSSRSVQDFQQLLRMSEIGPDAYESTSSDGRFGVTASWLRNAKDRWLSFDWEKFANNINAFPNYKVKVYDNGIGWTVHYVCLLSDRPDAIPLLLLHGWPGSFLEFLPMLQILSRKYSAATLPYHIVVPSLPGYGFSSPPPLDCDLKLEDVCRVLDGLMVRLGFHAGYSVHGGDIGSMLARIMGGSQARAKIIHLNFCIMPQPEKVPPTQVYTDAETKGLERAQEFQRSGLACALEQATRPSTIGLVLGTSPLSLLAWMGEKFLEWSDENLPLDTILESVALYWFTKTSLTSLWPYRELFSPQSIIPHANPRWYINKPLGFSWFPKETYPVPQSWVATTGNLVFWKQHDRGGHFAALEQTKALLSDLEDFIAQEWK